MASESHSCLYQQWHTRCCPNRLLILEVTTFFCVEDKLLRTRTHQGKQRGLICMVLLEINPDIEIKCLEEHTLEAIHLFQVHSSRLSVVAIRIDEVLVEFYCNYKACKEDAVNIAHRQRKATSIILEQTVDYCQGCNE